MKRVAIILLVVSTTAGCRQGIYECSDDGQCQDEAKLGGRCLVSGDARYCAFASADCDSKLAWDDTARDDLRGTCVWLKMDMADAAMPEMGACPACEAAAEVTDLSAADFAPALPDLAIPDIAISDLATPDASAPGDLGMPADLATAPDLRRADGGVVACTVTFNNAPYLTTMRNVRASGVDKVTGGMYPDIVLATDIGFEAFVLQKKRTYWPDTVTGLMLMPDQLAFADIDGDGKSDVVANSAAPGLGGGSGVSTLLSVGNGQFNNPTQLVAAQQQGVRFDVATGDLNGDGIPDIVASMYTGMMSIGVFLGTVVQGKAGTFATMVAIPAGMNATGVGLGDLNGDNKLDIVTTTSDAQPGTNHVVVLLGKGDGTFQMPSVAATGRFQPKSITVADVTGDGKNDVLLASSGPLLFPGKGNGMLDQSVPLGQGLFRYTDALAVGDLDGDKNLDIVLGVGSNLSRALGVLLGTGGGAFKSPTFYLVGGDYPSPKIADLDGDGHADVVVNGQYSVHLAYGKGDGTLMAPEAFVSPASGSVVTAGDVDGDGKADIVTGNAGHIDTFLGQVDPSLGTPLDTDISAVQTTSWQDCVLADFDGDKRLDLAIVDSSMFATVALGDKNGQGKFTRLSLRAVGSNPVSLAAADFDRDGAIDLAVANGMGANTVTLLHNRNNGFGDLDMAPKSPFKAGGDASQIVAGDFDNDQKIDLEVITAAGIFFLKGDGTGALEAPVTASMIGTWGPVAAEDLDRDGKLDLVLVNSGGAALLIGMGDGTFTKAPLPNLNLSPGGQYPPATAAIGDFNGDGLPDIMVGGVPFLQNDGPLYFLLNEGAGSFCVAQSLFGHVGGHASRAAVAADLNGDGRAEVALYEWYGVLGLFVNKTP